MIILPSFILVALQSSYPIKTPPWSWWFVPMCYSPLTAIWSGRLCWTVSGNKFRETWWRPTHSFIHFGFLFFIVSAFLYFALISRINISMWIGNAKLMRVSQGFCTLLWHLQWLHRNLGVLRDQGVRLKCKKFSRCSQSLFLCQVLMVPWGETFSRPDEHSSVWNLMTSQRNTWIIF